MTEHTTKQPSVKLCECGCGQPAPIAKDTVRYKGWVKGQPKRFISGHNKRSPKPLSEPNPSGLCMCGCGFTTPISGRTDSNAGTIKGKPKRYINGHNRPSGNWKSAKSPTPRDRFWEKVDKNGPLHPVLGTRCWVWLGSKSGAGYGVVRIEGRNRPAHRVSYELSYGSIPENCDVCHHCDNPPCVRPDHFFAGTDADNHRDRANKGRNNHTIGVAHPGAKLSEDDVISIRAFAAAGMTQRAITKRFAVTQATVWAIIHRKIWSHIP